MRLLCESVCLFASTASHKERWCEQVSDLPVCDCVGEGGGGGMVRVTQQMIL